MIMLARSIPSLTDSNTAELSLCLLADILICQSYSTTIDKDQPRANLEPNAMNVYNKEHLRTIRTWLIAEPYHVF